VKKIIILFIFDLGGFNNPKELNMLKQGNEFSTNSLLFVLPESEVVTWSYDLVQNYCNYITKIIFSHPNQ